jgi:hypothetical protein
MSGWVAVAPKKTKRAHNPNDVNVEVYDRFGNLVSSEIMDGKDNNLIQNYYQNWFTPDHKLRIRPIEKPAHSSTR